MPWYHYMMFAVGGAMLPANVPGQFQAMGYCIVLTTLGLTISHAADRICNAISRNARY